MKIQFTIALSDNPSDPDRPYWIDCNRDFNTGYEDFTEAEAHAVCAILNDADHMLDWDTITADCRWKLVEAQAEIERLRTALKMVKCVLNGDDITYFSESEVAQIDAALGKGMPVECKNGHTKS